jgi:hypothetical protein
MGIGSIYRMQREAEGDYIKGSEVCTLGRREIPVVCEYKY